MKANFSYLDVGVILSVVVSLIVLAVGVFAFFIVVSEIDVNESNETQQAIQNVTGVAPVFDILGIVLIIGAMMAIVGVIYHFVGGMEESDKETKVITKKEEVRKTIDTDKKTKKKKQKPSDEIEFDSFKKKKNKKDGWQI